MYYCTVSQNLTRSLSRTSRPARHSQTSTCTFSFLFCGPVDRWQHISHEFSYKIKQCVCLHNCRSAILSLSVKVLIYFRLTFLGNTKTLVLYLRIDLTKNTHNFSSLSSIYTERQKARPLNRFYQSITIPPKEGG